MPKHDHYQALDALGSQNVPRAITEKVYSQQHEVHHDVPGKRYPAWQCPSRKGKGNDMGVIPNAVNGSRMEYCTNAKGDAQNKLKGNDQTDGHYR